MDWRGATIAGTGFVMLPLFGRIIAAEQVIEMSAVDFILANVLHVSNLLAQVRIDAQIPQAGFFPRFSKYSGPKVFIGHNRPCWDLNSRLGKIGMPENQEPVSVGNIGKDFMDRWSHEAR
jgi:hypothetical protein